MTSTTFSTRSGVQIPAGRTTMSQNQSLSAFARARQPDVKRAASIIRSKSTVPSVVLAMAVSLIHGCGTTRPSKYYQLIPSVNPNSATSADPFPVTLILGRIRASHLYREDRIVYSGRGEEMGTYEYQRWTEPPTEMIEETLLRAFARIWSLPRRRLFRG